MKTEETQNKLLDFVKLFHFRSVSDQSRKQTKHLPCKRYFTLVWYIYLNLSYFIPYHLTLTDYICGFHNEDFTVFSKTYMYPGNMVLEQILSCTILNMMFQWIHKQFYKTRVEHNFDSTSSVIAECHRNSCRDFHFMQAVVHCTAIDHHLVAFFCGKSL